MAKNLSTVVSEDITAHTIMLSRYTGDLRQKMLRHLKKLEVELVQKIEALGDAATAQNKRVRLAKLLMQVQDSIKANMKGARDQHVEELKSLASVESKFAAKVLNRAIKIDLATPLLTPQVLKVLVKETLIEGSPAAEWWGRQAEDLRRRFSDQIRMGFSIGESPPDMVRRIRGTATGKWISMKDADGEVTRVREFTGGVMEVSTRQANALVRTSVQTIANAARNETYKKNDTLIKAVQAHVTFDLRTSDICKPRENWAWYIDTGEPLTPEENNGIVTPIHFPGPPPWHWNCRTSLIPITYSWEELAARAGGNKQQRKIARIVDNNLSVGARQSMDGQVSQSYTYETWLKEQSVKRQKEALGLGKWELWSKGKITFRDMIDQEARPLSLREIEANL